MQKTTFLWRRSESEVSESNGVSTTSNCKVPNGVATLNICIYKDAVTTTASYAGHCCNLCS